MFALNAMKKKWGTIFDRPREKKKFEKSIDNPETLCYNKYNERRKELIP